MKFNKILIPVFVFFISLMTVFAATPDKSKIGDTSYIRTSLGVGEDTPSETLDVAGNISVNGLVDTVDVSVLKSDFDTLDGNVGDITADEANQIENIGSVTVSNLQWEYLGILDQDLTTNDDVTFATVNTGQGNNELYAMNQDVETSDNVYFNSVSGDGLNLSLDSVSGSEYSKLRDYFNLQTDGKIIGGRIKDNGDGTVNVTAGSGITKKTDSLVGNSTFVSWSASNNLAMVNDSINYIYVDYNNGNPVVGTETTFTNTYRKFYLGQVYRFNNEIDVLNDGVRISSSQDRIDDWVHGVFGNVVRGSGILLSETGTRNIALSEGTFYAGFENNTFPDFDSSTSDGFMYMYRDGSGGWERVYNQSQIDNERYDDGSGTLAELTNDYYAVHWVYADFGGDVHVLYGQDEYVQLSDAEAASPPNSLPTQLKDFASLAGRVIVEENATNFTAVESAYATTFDATPVTDHGELSGLNDNDHSSVYVEQSGSNSNLDMGNYDIFNVDKINATDFFDDGINLLSEINTKFTNPSEENLTMSDGDAINHQENNGITRTFNNGCYEKSNSTGIFVIC